MKRKTTEEFIQEAIKVHGNKYDYSEVEYINGSSKVKIFCNECQRYFYQRPLDHIHGQGCPYCNKKEKLNKESFILRATIKHKDKYDYNNVKYINYHTKVEIICNKCHNHFWQAPSKHLKGQGCPCCAKDKCGKYKEITKEDFIKKANITHKNKFDYSLVNFINTSTKVEIVCNKCHNHFWQIPSSHLCGNGCPYCAQKSRIKKWTLSKENFLENAYKIHGNKYNYNNIEYKNRSTKIKIFCNKCKKFFWQIPTSHLSGHGCIYCGIKAVAQSKINTLEQFIEKAQKIHGNRYNYSEVEYVSSKELVKIKCNKCQKYFLQTPNRHLKGQGCPYCNQSKGEIKIKRFLEENNIEYIFQKRFKDCKDKQQLPFDFYLPDYNICIEFQGEQHYKLRFYLGKFKSKIEAVEYFQKQQYHDQIKRDYCKKNNIQLIEIKYNENIEEKLKDILNE